MSTTSKRKQRKQLFNAPLHTRKKMISGHLSGELIDKYNRRSIPLAKGDIVSIVRGDMKGHIGKIMALDTKKMRINVEGANITKADNTEISMKIHPSNIIVTKLDLSDKVRKNRIEGGKGA